MTLNISSNKAERKHFLFLTYVLNKNRTEELLTENFSDELIYLMIHGLKKTRQASINKGVLLPSSHYTQHFSLRVLQNHV